jgi:type IV fimbrial biogenesis protein FimT
MNRKRMDAIYGITIIELLVSLAVVAILSSIAAPSFISLIQDNRLVTQLNELQASLSFARSEAIKRNNTITTCRSHDGQSCEGKGDWKKGWLIFVDTDVDSIIDIGETILLQHGPISTNNTITFNRSRIIYNGSGITRGGSNGTFTFCDKRGISSARGIVISNTGRARLAADSNANGIVENGSQENVSCP